MRNSCRAKVVGKSILRAAATVFLRAMASWELMDSSDRRIWRVTCSLLRWGKRTGICSTKKAKNRASRWLGSFFMAERSLRSGSASAPALGCSQAAREEGGEAMGLRRLEELEGPVARRPGAAERVYRDGVLAEEIMRGTGRPPGLPAVLLPAAAPTPGLPAALVPLAPSILVWK